MFQINDDDDKNRIRIFLLLFFLFLGLTRSSFGQMDSNISANESKECGMQDYGSIPHHFLSLVKNLSGEVSGNSVLVRFKDTTFPIKFTGDYPDMTIIIEGKKNNCMELDIHFENLEGDLGLVSTRGTECPLPKEGQGNFILDFVDKISAELKLSEVSLQDSANILCKENNKATSLTFLKIIEKGRGWYESHGYKIKNEQSYNNYRDAIDNLMTIPLENLANKVKSFKKTHLKKMEKLSIVNLKARVAKKQMSEKQKATTLKLTSDEYRTYFSVYKQNRILFNTKMKEFLTTGKIPNLSNFLRWLWEKDCGSYIQMKDFLFPQGQLDNGLETAPLGHRIYTASYLYKKFVRVE